MGLVCRLTHWPKQTLSCFAVLPLVVAVAGQHVPMDEHVWVVEHQILVKAEPAQVWQSRLNSPEVNTSNYSPAWLHHIGVPLPLSGTTRQTEIGLVRRVTMGKQIYFDEVIAEQRELRYLRWTCRRCGSG